ncbi:hypothetical protein V9T40_013888 [Parthenolecanium corni]|uniref:Medium-chain acyl-CoA ligase ACSF2, mitochondrial n=1 Tax=Parthenolecanium corni TaxID=536013 RepID=A0AAN9Y2X1_9HEMI
MKPKITNEAQQREKLSYWKNSGEEPLKNWKISDIIKEATEKYPNRDAICAFGGSRLTYGESFEKIESLAKGLLALGLNKGDHVGIWAPNIVEWYISFLAIIRAGLVAVNLNPLYECPEIELALKKSQVKVLIMGESLNERNYYQMFEKLMPEIAGHDFTKSINCSRLPHLKILISITASHLKGAYRWIDILSMGTSEYKTKLDQMEAETNVHDICNIQFTSGTTGTMKGAMLSHFNVINNSYFTSKRMLLREKHHTICLQVPFFHTFGTVLGILVAIQSGATIVLPSLKFSPSKSIDAIIKEKCTVVYGTPTMFTDLITVTRKRLPNDPSIYKKLSSLELALTSGAYCTPELFKEMKKVFNFKRIQSGYGMTEVSPIAFYSQPDDSMEVATTTVGYPLDHVEIKVIDENDRLVPFGTPGECCFKGFGVMRGYFNDPEMTRKAFLNNEWIRSGDRFILLENGYGQIVGRIKDTINRGGENIEPVDIENVLAAHPDVESVQVYAVSDERLGEVVACSLVKYENSKLDEAALRKFCEGKLASYKIPKYIRFVNDYPRTATGKIQKYRLREMLEKELNLFK